MKMTADHFKELTELMSNISKAEISQHRDHLKNLMETNAEGAPKDLEMRLRWDTYRYSESKWSADQGFQDLRILKFICSTLYNYLDDTHIDTALKKIIQDIESKVEEK